MCEFRTPPKGRADAEYDCALLAADCEPAVVVEATKARKLGNDLLKQQKP
jgi:hypothetical protein